MLAEYKSSTKTGLIAGTIIVIVGKLIGFGSYEVGSLVALIGGITFIWGCVSFMKGKGHSGWWGALGIFFLLGLIVLLFFSDRHKQNGAQPTDA